MATKLLTAPVAASSLIEMKTALDNKTKEGAARDGAADLAASLRSAASEAGA